MAAKDSTYFPFQVRVEVLEEDGQWWPYAQGSSYSFLRQHMQECEAIGRVRLTAWWGDVVEIPS